MSAKSSLCEQLGVLTRLTDQYRAWNSGADPRGNTDGNVALGLALAPNLLWAHHRARGCAHCQHVQLAEQVAASSWAKQRQSMAGLSRWQFVIKGFDKQIVEDCGQYIMKVTPPRSN